MTIDVLTIFPRLIELALSEGVVARARESGRLEIRARDLRDFTDDRHRSVDDVPFGGGPGMIMKPEPIARAIEAVEAERGRASAVILMTPQGRRFTQAEAERLSGMERLIVICGRYEGVDERLAQSTVTDEFSIGDYVLTGGELPALVLIDAAARLVPGVVGDAESVEVESFVGGLLDYPHYTRPAEWRGREVPAVLLSGHHAEIDRWRRRERLKRTLERRPDLLAEAALDSGMRRELDALRDELAERSSSLTRLNKEKGNEGD